MKLAEDVIEYQSDNCSVLLYRESPAKVYLVSHSVAASQLVATVSRTFEGTITPDIYSIPPEDAQKSLDELDKTALQGPLEFAHFCFLIKDVSRSFTHQLVRYRVGTSFIQESLRFTEVRQAKILLTGGTANQPKFIDGLIASMEGYQAAIQAGIPIQDAKNILPTGILTSIWLDINFRTLLHIYSQRMCSQAQREEWQPVLRQMRDYVKAIYPSLGALLYTHGPCPYKSKWDRTCELEVDGRCTYA